MPTILNMDKKLLSSVVTTLARKAQKHTIPRLNSGSSMQYNHLMTDIVFAIRARLSPQYKHNIRTSNPELLGDLAELYHITQDMTLRSFIEELMQHAGTTWQALLQTAPYSPVQLHRSPSDNNSASPYAATA